MGWGTRFVAILVILIFFVIGAWPIGLLIFLYLAYSIRRPKAKAVFIRKQEVFGRPGRPWGRYLLGGALFLLAPVALEAGGALSPIAFLIGGAAVIFWPRIERSGFANRVVPIRDSVLLRSSFLPFRWHALVEVKLESQDQTRGIAAMNGRLLLFAGKTPSTFLVVNVHAFTYKQAEEGVVNKLRKETRMLSQRGAHLLPLDSADAAGRLCMGLERLKARTDDLQAVSSLPFDVLALHVKDGLIVSHRAFNISEPVVEPSIPQPDLPLPRQPLFAEVVEKIGERHGWPGPDEFSPFLAALDASRTEPLADRFRTKGEDSGRAVVDTPGGAEVKLTRPQLRAAARIYG